MKKIHGFTLFEGLMTTGVVLGVIFVLAIAGITIGRGCTVAILGSKAQATAEAQTWLKEMGYAGSNISCMDRDTDSDGYVSCTVRPVQGAPFALGCAERFTLNHGCKIEPFATFGNASVPVAPQVGQ